MVSLDTVNLLLSPMITDEYKTMSHIFDKTLPCPICGEIEDVEWSISFSNTAGGYYIYCNKHKTDTIVGPELTIEKAVEVWNGRR